MNGPGSTTYRSTYQSSISSYFSFSATLIFWNLLILLIFMSSRRSTPSSGNGPMSNRSNLMAGIPSAGTPPGLAAEPTHWSDEEDSDEGTLDTNQPTSRSTSIAGSRQLSGTGELSSASRRLGSGSQAEVTSETMAFASSNADPRLYQVRLIDSDD